MRIDATPLLRRKILLASARIDFFRTVDRSMSARNAKRVSLIFLIAC